MEKRIKEVVFGIGGACDPCDSSHAHPLNNIINIIYYEEGEYEEFLLQNPEYFSE